MADWPYNTNQWARLRKTQLGRKPLCEDCLKLARITIANTVDHIVPISQGGDPFPSHDDLRSLCAACHSAKTARGPEAGAVRSDKPRKGCGLDGWPLDPEHPFYHPKREG